DLRGAAAPDPRAARDGVGREARCHGARAPARGWRGHAPRRSFRARAALIRGLVAARCSGPYWRSRAIGIGGCEVRLLHALWLLAALCVAPLAWSEEPDHAIHEELRGVLRGVVGAINSGKYDAMLPYLAENVEATSVTQEVMTGRGDI